MQLPTTTRLQLAANALSVPQLYLAHHAMNAARAKVYAGQGRRADARWYGKQARSDFAAYQRAAEQEDDLLDRLRFRAQSGDRLAQIALRNMGETL